MIKKVIIIFIIVFFSVAAGLYLSWDYVRNIAFDHYNSIDAGSVPAPKVTVAGQEVKPAMAYTEIPVFGEWQVRNPDLASYLYGILFLGTTVLPEKPLTLALEDGTSWSIISETGCLYDSYILDSLAADLGLVGEAPFTLDMPFPEETLPGGYELRCSLTAIGPDGKEGEVASSGEQAAGQIVIPNAGTYRLDIQISAPRTEEDIFLADSFFDKRLDLRWGLIESGWMENRPDIKNSLSYRMTFSVKNPDPVLITGRTELKQGDIFAIRLENVPEGIVPELETELGPAVFTRGAPAPQADGEPPVQPEGLVSWFAAVPVSNIRAPGEYAVTVTAGDLVYEASVKVGEYEFSFQNMIIDMSVPSNAAATSPKAGAEFREKVTPLFPLFSEEIYWSGPFIMPVDLGEEGFISTEFGEIRITNGNMNTKRSHLGMDLAVRTGTPVHAAGAGRVLLAEFLLMTGNTVIIDHGGGLKSIYYHMNSVDTEAGRVVQQGELIGTVGSTGYSTGPHLHFEMRIGEQPISPSMLFSETAGLYSAW